MSHAVVPAFFARLYPKLRTRFSLSGKNPGFLANTFSTNYPILWGGQHERPVNVALMLPTPQSIIVFFCLEVPKLSSQPVLMKGG
ncbi:hypothetical protein A6V25_12040 [Nostoc sp. ATCC 53789]|nr:hypothetical protein A6V25_12040 [Nostoc sp. ATCC 53789]